jgi:hypothetical protein
MTLGTMGIATITFLAFALVVLYVMRNNISESNAPNFSPLPPTETMPPSPTDTATSDGPTPLPNPNATAASAAVGAPNSASGVAILITVHERTPLRITVDDQVVYNGVPVPITSFKYQAKTSVQIHTGDAGAIDVVVNGIQQPPLGPSHAIADKTYTTDGVSNLNLTTNVTSDTPVASQIPGYTVTPGFKP